MFLESRPEYRRRRAFPVEIGVPVRLLENEQKFRDSGLWRRC